MGSPIRTTMCMPANLTHSRQGLMRSAPLPHMGTPILTTSVGTPILTTMCMPVNLHGYVHSKLTCDMTRSHACYTIHSYDIWMCDMTHPYVWHDSYICVTWLIHMCDVSHSYVWHDSSICKQAQFSAWNHGDDFFESLLSKNIFWNYLSSLSKK